MKKKDLTLLGFSERNDSSKKLWALLLIALCCFTTNMCFSARDGYLGIFADANHISGFVYGLFKANYIVGYVLMGLFNKALLKCCSARCVILFGLFGHGVCLIVAALTYNVLMGAETPSPRQKVTFEVLTCCFQAIQGGMMSSVTLSSLSLGSTYYKDDMGKVNGTYYLGAVIPHGIVPVIANAIYTTLGYSPPLYIFGVITFLLSFIACFIFVSKDFDFRFDDEDDTGSISSLPYRTFIPLVQSYILTAYLSYLQLTLPKYVRDELGFSVIEASSPLFVLMMFIAFVNIIITYFYKNESKNILYFLLIACILDAMAAFFIFPPNDATGWKEAGRIYLYPLLCVIGMSDAYSTINTTPAMNYLYSTARVREPTPGQQHTMSSLWIAGNGLSYAIGAYLAGFIDQVLVEDFHKAGIFWGIMSVVCVFSLIIPITTFNNTGEQYKIIEEGSTSSVSECG